MATLKFLIIFTFLTLILKLHVYARSLSNNSMASVGFSRHAGEAGIGFGARLIHWSNPESPFYDPNASPIDILKSLFRSSTARAKYFENIMSNNNSRDSRKYPISRISITDHAYVMSFSVGSDPPLNTYGIADTGSTITWLQCEPCKLCYKQSVPYYDPRKSSTYGVVTCYHPDCGIALGGQMSRECASWTSLCPYAVSYADGSQTVGLIVSDTLRFQSSDKSLEEYFEFKGAVFGCGVHNTLHKGMDVTKPFSPGLVGLSNQTGSLIRQLNLGLFSYCISENAWQETDTSQIRFGSAANISGLFSTALAPPSRNGFYFFENVDGIYLNDVKLGGYPEGVFKYVEGGRGGLFIDNGSVLTILHNSVFDALVEQIKNMVYSKSKVRPEKDRSKTGWDLCYNNNDFKIDDLPEIEFRFSDADYGIPYRFRNYWLYNEARQSCLAIHKGGDAASTLGVTQLLDINVGFDLVNNMVSFSQGWGCPNYNS